jgi:hypothetical protein
MPRAAVRNWTQPRIFAEMLWHLADDNLTMMRIVSCARRSAKLLRRHQPPDPEAADGTRLSLYWRLRIPPFLAVQLLLAAFVLVLPVSAQQGPVGDSGARPCKLSGQKAPVEKKPAKRKNKNAEQADTNSEKACLEVHASSLEVQEHLQAFVREQRWGAGDEDISEDVWSFSMQLSKQQLLSYTKLDATTERVNWRNGKASVFIQTTELNDGYTRTVVRTYFDGFGESEDDIYAMKRDSWKLPSNGSLEATLIGALHAHFHANHRITDNVRNRRVRAIF